MKGTYLQSNYILRKLYVRAPEDSRSHWYERRTIWKLSNLSHGTKDDGKTKLRVAEECMLGDGGIERVVGVSQVHIQRRVDKCIAMMVRKQSDDFTIYSF